MELSTEEQVFIMQLYAQGLLSKRTAIERLGFVEDTDMEIARIRKEERERASDGAFD